MECCCEFCIDDNRTSTIDTTHNILPNTMQDIQRQPKPKNLSLSHPDHIKSHDP